MYGNYDYLRTEFHLSSFNPDYAVGIVTRVEKPQRNEKLERFCAEGILVNMLRSKIVKRALQQGFSGRSRWLLHNLGLTQCIAFLFYSFGKNDNFITPNKEAGLF
ncbi:MAG: hypothetical protein R6T98_14605 [Desulfatiglandales bacterium]